MNENIFKIYGKCFSTCKYMNIDTTRKSVGKSNPFTNILVN